MVRNLEYNQNTHLTSIIKFDDSILNVIKSTIIVVCTVIAFD